MIRGHEVPPVVNAPVRRICGYVRTVVAGIEAYAFTGISFAQPPIGDLRYKKPQPVTPWGDNTFDGTKTPPSCIQVDVFLARCFVWVPYGLQKSEDCLYLNVWTPTLSGSTRLPVMAWLHGGEFQVGSAAMRLDDGANLAALGKVVVVTIAYRCFFVV
ncbi:hypothetical protein V5799_021982 [Amblyomma americanum]|uniref:Carboxylesterase type B domain-containing protein n=1 Tax=Amblyomma americanum TaxID=6943 RepID=A0AAQ4FNA3_AMBAM